MWNWFFIFSSSFSGVFLLPFRFWVDCLVLFLIWMEVEISKGRIQSNWFLINNSIISSIIVFAQVVGIKNSFKFDFLVFYFVWSALSIIFNYLDIIGFMLILFFDNRSLVFLRVSSVYLLLSGQSWNSCVKRPQRDWIF